MASSVFHRKSLHGAILGVAVATGAFAAPIGAFAQVAYDEWPLFNPFSPYDESYGVSPSFEILPRRDGVPAVRIVQRCQYPNGWNVTDFSRDVNGIPAGVDHACRPLRQRERY